MNQTRDEPSLPRQPRLHRSYYLMPVPGSDHILMYREGRGVNLRPHAGLALLPRLVELLDGSRTVDALVEQLAEFGSSPVLASLARLQELGLLEDGADPEPSTEPAAATRTLLSHVTSDPSAAMEALAAASVVVFDLGLVARCLRSMLEASGVGQLSTPQIAEVVAPRPTPATAPSPLTAPSLRPFAAAVPAGPRFGDIRPLLGGVSLAVVALDHPDPGLMEAVNTACIDAEVALLPVALVGWEGHLGPTYVPGRTACYRCFDLRAKSNLSSYEQHVLYEDALRRRPGQQPFGWLPHFPNLLAGMAATEVIKVVTSCYPPTTYGRCLVVDLLMSETEGHDVLRVPGCPACGRRNRGARPSSGRAGNAMATPAL